MTLKYDSFVGELWSKYPALASRQGTPESDLLVSEFQDFVKAGYLNFKAGKKSLYRISRMLERQALKNSAPLLAAFEREGLYKYAQKRYEEMVQRLPKAWIIGDFNNPHLAQNLPPTATVVSCVGTNLVYVWAVITRGPVGPMGLVAEELPNGDFKGFFTISPPLIRYTISKISESLGVSIDIEKDEHSFDHGGY